ncbi:MAG: glycine cleavage system protein H [Candidatus Omnitrophica bacterium]|nr:glycine cleavage system protein H [Candidatus Omnitrophota bacterium]
MPEYLETTVGKFTFRVATDRLYTGQGIWVKPETKGSVRVGLADFPQQSNGDIAFASVKPAGTKLEAGESLADIETIKAMVELLSPVGGTVVEVNPALDLQPEIVNQDPYDRGWLAIMETTDLEADCARLLEPSAYFSVMLGQLQEELKKL